MFAALAGGFLTTEPPGKSPNYLLTTLPDSVPDGSNQLSALSSRRSVSNIRVMEPPPLHTSYRSSPLPVG